MASGPVVVEPFQLLLPQCLAWAQRTQPLLAPPVCLQLLMALGAGWAQTAPVTAGHEPQGHIMAVKGQAGARGWQPRRPPSWAPHLNRQWGLAWGQAGGSSHNYCLIKLLFSTLQSLCLQLFMRHHVEGAERSPALLPEPTPQIGLGMSAADGIRWMGGECLQVVGTTGGLKDGKSFEGWEVIP